MRVPVLRETRMPALAVEIGPPRTVVEDAPVLVDALARAIRHWVLEPLGS
jgi:N-acetylmuramoyl-L-alanine amidase